MSGGVWRSRKSRGAHPFPLWTLPSPHPELRGRFRAASVRLGTPVGFPQVPRKGSFLRSPRREGGELRLGPLQGSSPEPGSRPGGGGRAGGGSREIWGWSSLYRTEGPLGACLGRLCRPRVSPLPRLLSFLRWTQPALPNFDLNCRDAGRVAPWDTKWEYPFCISLPTRSW